MFAPAASAPRTWLLAATVLSGLAPSCTTTGNRSALVEILTRIERREVADGFLQQALEQGDEPTRAWAARGLGASRSPAALAPLIQSLGDESTWVRSAGLFALPMLEGLSTEQATTRKHSLLEHLKSSEPVLRFLAAQALGRIESRPALDPLLEALVDPAPTVRRAAAFALLQLAGDRTRSRTGVDLSADTRELIVTAWTKALAIERDAETRWHLVYSLAHCIVPGTAATLRTTAQSQSAGRWERLFALRGLGHLPTNPASVSTLRANLQGTDAVLVYEALSALARLSPQWPTWPAGLANSIAALALEHTAPHVRARAIAVLGGARQHDSTESALEAALQDPSPTVQAAAIEALARSGTTAPLIAALRAKNTDWRAQLGAARGVALLEPTIVAELLPSLPDLDPRVELELLASLGNLASDAKVEISAEVGRALTSWTIARLERDDPAFVEASADALAALEATASVEQLAKAWRDSAGLTERTAATAAARRIGYATARAQLARAIAKLAPDHPSLREIADLDPVESVRHATGVESSGDAVATVRPGPDFGEEITTEFLFRKPRPRVRFRTVRGSIVIELLPELAPVHCFNLLQLVEKGNYDGRPFHRVVPNFVVQGGDARGDGFGNVAWYDGQLRDELNPLPLLAGRVGMPRTQDRDTGGDQLFIATVPTPHLDGHYTAFARVVEGLDTVRRIEIGDVIEAAEIVD